MMDAMDPVPCYTMISLPTVAALDKPPLETRAGDDLTGPPSRGPRPAVRIIPSEN